MPHGYTGCVLRVDLSSGRIEEDHPDESFYRLYVGGRAVVAYYLLREVPRGADPLGPDNLLIFAPGVLTGAFVSGQGRNGIGAKSPLTGGFGNAEAGDYWGAELKRAGYDAVVIRGCSPRPVYLAIGAGGAELRPAGHLWGLTTGETEAALRADLGEPLLRTAIIGPAGENRVRFACIVNDRSHFGGRTGLGAVMGAKGLKALAVRAPRGLGRMSVADPAGVGAIAKWMGGNLDLVADLHDTGTAGGLKALHLGESLPAYNFQAGRFAGADAIDGATMRDTILVSRETCAACAVRCKRAVALEEPYRVDRQYGGPEYETLAAFGSLQGISDLPALARANERCAAYGLDSISTGAVIAFAMECAEAGLLDPGAAGGPDLRWGNTAAMLEAVEQIAFRRGLGDLLAEGVRRAAAQIGGGAEEFAMHVRGQELPMHEPRAKHALAVGYAVSPTGADHMHNFHDVDFGAETSVLEHLRTFGDFRPIPALGITAEKIAMLYYQTNWRHFLDCAVMCHFLPYSPQQMAELVHACTGWQTSPGELVRVGERAASMARAFNVREGLGAEADSLPRRFFRDFLRGGQYRQTAPVDREAFAAGKAVYCAMMGWDPATGAPLPERLADLGIGWVGAALRA